MNKKVLFCGGGNMAEGVLRCLLKNKVVDCKDVTISELSPDRCEYLKEKYSVEAVTDATEAMKTADMVIVAVLPKIVPVVAKSLVGVIKNDAVVLSIAAGVKLETYEEILGKERKIVRVMPNTLGQSGNGHSAVCFNGNMFEEDKAFALEVIGSLGQTIVLPETMFGEFTAYSCSGPLWLYQMADVLVDAGVYIGFNRADAKKMVIKNMLGVAMILDETGDDPKERVNEMCSPGGVTIEGYKSLADEGFASAVMTSVDKAVKKANSIK